MATHHPDVPMAGATADPDGVATTARPKPLWRQVALPTEHGGWSLTAEPILLGLLVAPSWPGLALGMAALVAFVARTPIKLVLVDRWRHRWLERTTMAARIAAGELVVLVVLVALAGAAVATAPADRAAAGTESGAGAAWPFWLPLALAAPLIGTELWFDMRSRSRRLLPELAGTIGIGSVAAAIALVGGTGTVAALGLWAVMTARAAAAIPHVRTQLARARTGPRARPRAGTPARTGPGHLGNDGAQVVGVAVVATAWLLGAAPLAAAVVLAGIAVVNLVAVRRPPRRAVVIGIQQMVHGLAVVVVTATAVLIA